MRTAQNNRIREFLRRKTAPNSPVSCTVQYSTVSLTFSERNHRATPVGGVAWHELVSMCSSTLGSGFADLSLLFSSLLDSTHFHTYVPVASASALHSPFACAPRTALHNYVIIIIIRSGRGASYSLFFNLNELAANEGSYLADAE